MPDNGITIAITVNEVTEQVSMDAVAWANMQGNSNAVYLLLARLEHLARIKGDTQRNQAEGERA